MTKKIYIVLLLLGCLNGRAQNVPSNATGPNQANPLTLLSLPLQFNTAPNPTFSTYNYSRTFAPNIATTASNVDLNVSSYYDISTAYVNGWGQTMQTIIRGNANSKDLITPVDNRMSLTQNSFLPYAGNYKSKFQNTAFQDQRNFYSSLYPNEGGTSYSQNVVDYDNYIGNFMAPAVETYMPGRSFTGAQNGSKTTSTFNDTDHVVNFSVVNGIPVDMGFYAQFQLHVKNIIGQHNENALLYYDKSARLVCKKILGGVTIDTN